MSYRTRAFVGIHCDQPGCKRQVDLNDTEWYADMERARDAADKMGYQTIDAGEDDKRIRHYCPKHTHATCMQCGCRQTGELVNIIAAGWRDPLDTSVTLCPTCATLPAINPCKCGATPILDNGGDYEGLTLMGNHAKITCPNCGRTVSDDAPTTLNDITRQVIESWNGNRRP